MIVLTPAQANDLRYLVALFRLTIGLSAPRAALGDSVRTGRSLRLKGLVRPAERQYANRRGTWIPSHAGLAYVEQNFKRDGFATEAAQRAIQTLEAWEWR